jgi:hypothetical protein
MLLVRLQGDALPIQSTGSDADDATNGHLRHDAIGSPLTPLPLVVAGPPPSSPGFTRAGLPSPGGRQ